MKPLNWWLISLSLFLMISCAGRRLDKLSTQEKLEMEKILAKNRWTTEHGYATFQFKYGFNNSYRIKWPGSDIDHGTWRIKDMGLYLKSTSSPEGKEEKFAEITRFTEEEVHLIFDNGEKYYLRPVEQSRKEKKKNNIQY